MEHWWNDADKRKLKYLEDNLPSASLSILNPTRPGEEWNPNLRCVKAANDFLYHHFITGIHT